MGWGYDLNDETTKLKYFIYLIQFMIHLLYI